MHLFHLFTLLIVIPDIDTRYDRNPSIPFMPHILAVPLSPLRRPESGLLLHDRLRYEGRHAIPARKHLERLLCLLLVLTSGIVPGEVIRKLPAATLRDLKELVPVYGTGDPDVAEGRTTVDPIHGVGHIGGLEKVLVDELKDVFHAEGDVVNEEDGRVGGEILGEEESGWKAWLRRMASASTRSPLPALGSMSLVMKW